MTIDPRRTGLLFPGQGSQAVGMGHPLAHSEAVAAQTFSEADAILGFPLSRICWEGPPETLHDTEYTQPALLTHSVAVLRTLHKHRPDFVPACTAGHSLGEFSALVACGALSFAEALRLVRARGLAMKQAGEQTPGGMAAVLGMDTPQVEAICRQTARALGGVVQVANDNCPGQVVISGDERCLTAAMQALRISGARKLIRLAVSIASHSPLMTAAQSAFAPIVDQAPFGDPAMPVIGNVTASPLRTAAEIRADVRAQLTSPVRWTESIRAMVLMEVDTFLELGSGSVLTGLVRRIEPEARAHALDSLESLAVLEI